MEKRLHRPGFHFKKSLTFQTSNQEKHKSVSSLKTVSLIDTTRTIKPSPIEQTLADDHSIAKEIRIIKTQKEEEKNKLSSQSTQKIINIKEQNEKDIVSSPSIEIKSEVNNEEQEPDQQTKSLVIIANILAIISFVFGLLTIISVVLAFIMSLTLILPLLPALVAFFSGGLSLILGLPTKQENYKSGFATKGLIVSLIFFGFLATVLAGVIYI